MRRGADEVTKNATHPTPNVEYACLRQAEVRLKFLGEADQTRRVLATGLIEDEDLFVARGPPPIVCADDTPIRGLRIRAG
jgi:hypothetical protein